MKSRMNLQRRTLCASIAAAPFVLSGLGSVRAQGRPYTLVIPYPPGGATDTFGRLYADSFGSHAKANVVVENRPGADSAIGLRHVAQAPADGYTLTYAYGNLALAMAAKKPTAPHIVRDLVPVIRTIVTQGLIVTGMDSRFKTFDDFIEEAKRSPGKVTYADYGELAVSDLMQVADIDLLRVPYKGGGPGIVDVIAGHVDIYAGSAAAVIPNIRGGRLKALATTSESRIADLPDVPTVREVFPEFSIINYQGVFAPKDTPPDVLERLYEQSLAAISTPKFHEQAKEHYASVSAMNPAEFRKFMEEDAENIAKLVKAMG